MEVHKSNAEWVIWRSRRGCSHTENGVIIIFSHVYGNKKVYCYKYKKERWSQNEYKNDLQSVRTVIV